MSCEMALAPVNLRRLNVARWMNGHKTVVGVHKLIVIRGAIQYNTIQYNIRLLGLDRTQANNTGSGYA